MEFIRLIMINIVDILFVYNILIVIRYIRYDIRVWWLD